LLIALLLVSVCSQPTSGTASSSARLAAASGLLEAQVAMPAGFPPDVPIYPRARLIAEASFTSPGRVLWSMEWETLDKLARVLAFYQQQLSQSGWTFNLKASTGTTFSAVAMHGTVYSAILAADATTGVTKILLSLAVSAD
jgi:hypothetical protein